SRRHDVPLRFVHPAFAGRAGQGGATARGPLAPADAVAVADGAALGRRLLLLRRDGRAVRAHGGVLRRPRPFAGAGLGGDLADPADGGGGDLRHGPAVRSYRPAPGQPALLGDPGRLVNGLRLRDQSVGHLHPVGDPRHSLHRHRAGLRADPAPTLWSQPRRLATRRGHAVRHGRNGDRRLDGRGDLRCHPLLPLGLPARARLRPSKPDAAWRALFLATAAESGNRPVMNELCKLTAVRAVTLLKKREITPLELVEASAQRIAEVEPAVNALPTLCLDRARDHAKRIIAGGEACEASGEAGWLAGLPVSIKDLTDVAGVRTTYGSPIFANHVPAKSHPVVERIERKGGL